MSSRRGNPVSKLYCLNSNNKETDISEEDSSFLTLLLYIAPVKVKYMCKFALLEIKIRISYIYSQLNPK